MIDELTDEWVQSGGILNTIGVKRLRWWAAIFDALLCRGTEYFPRAIKNNIPVTLKNDEILVEIVNSLKDLGAGSDADLLKTLVERGRESLDEVKALTEYQDQKSTRLLTVATLFVALAGLLMNAFAEGHPVRIIPGGVVDLGQIGPAIVYGLFGLFVLSVISGALVTFHANQTRFRYPAPTAIKSDNKPKSHIFFIEMIRMSPKAWAESFVEASKPRSVPAKDLSLRYAKNYIAESYLVAAKVADKMRYLEAAQAILGTSLRILLVWMLVLSGVSALQPGVDGKERPAKVEVTVQLPER